MLQQMERGCLFTYTFINNFRIVGRGPGNNFLARQVTRVIFDACENTTTVVVDQFSVDCR